MIELDKKLLEKRKEKIREEIEDQPRETLIHKLAVFEMKLEGISETLKELYSLEDLKSVVIENDLLGSPSFLQKNIEIRPTFKLEEFQGFYSLEGDINNYYRWAKPNFYFDLPVDRTEERTLALKIRCDEGVEDTISCYANGKEVSLSVEKTEESYILSGTLESEKILSSTRISFLVDKIFMPFEKNAESTDTRQLSVIFQNLRIS